ncbi:ABC transporter permease [Virgibacillus flavescens]|uniref:ABC transporter permease n=1 Tax=Virgibacillus flavescens TaxID=1611422 RepID=UPI003D325707
MRNFYVLWKKEMIESGKNGKWIWLPIVFMIIGITQPITSYYMPVIIEQAGNLPEGAIIKLPTPTGAEVLASTLSQYGTIGTLLFVLATMGVISNEKSNGAVTLVMVRPVSALQYVSSKWFGQLIIAILSLFASYLLTWYYTNLLFTSVDWLLVLQSFLIYGLWVALIVSFTIWMGTIFKGNGAIAGISISFLGVLALLTNLLPKFMTWSPANLSEHATTLLMDQPSQDHLFVTILSTIFLCIIFFVLAVGSFKRTEQY